MGRALGLAGIGLAMLGAACGSRTVKFPDLPLDSTSKTVVLIFKSPNERTFAVLDATRPDAAAADRSYRGQFRVEVTALVYTSSTGELLLEPMSEPSPVPSSGRPLPFPKSTYKAVVEGRNASDWTSTTTDSLFAVRLPAADPSACPGCIVSAANGQACESALPPDALCKTPCPIRAPKAPRAVLAPNLPDPATVTCPYGQGTPGMPLRCSVPAPARADCAFPEAQFFGEVGCKDADPDCPSGPGWRSDIVSLGDAIYYVSAAAAPMRGDGSMASPYASIAEALAARSGGVLALAQGTYDVSSAQLSGFALWGRCVRDTILTADHPSSDTVVQSPRALHHLTVRGANFAGVRTAPSSVLDRVFLDVAGQIGLLVAASTVTASNLVIQRAAWSVFLDRGAKLDLSGAVTQTSTFSLVLRDGAHAGLTDTVLWGARSTGIIMGNASTLTATRTDIAGGGDGVAAGDRGTRIVLRDSLVRDLVPPYGHGIEVQHDAFADLSRVALANNAGNGVYMHERGRARISSTLFASNGGGGLGNVALHVRSGSRAEADHLLFDANAFEAVLAIDDGSELVLSDTRIQAALGPSGAPNEACIFLGRGATLEASRVVIASSDRTGLYSDRSRVSLTDVASDQGSAQFLAFIAMGSTVTMQRVAFSNSLGLVFTRSARAQLEDIASIGTTGLTSTGFGVVDHADVSIVGFASLDNHGSDLFVSDGARARISDLTISTQDRPAHPSIEVGNLASLSLVRASIDARAGDCLRAACASVDASDVRFQCLGMGIYGKRYDMCPSSTQAIALDRYTIQAGAEPTRIDIGSGTVLRASEGELIFPGMCSLGIPGAGPTGR